MSVAIIIVIFGSLQLIYYKVMTGKFLFNSYGGNAGEGLELLHPYLLEVLFSYRKGWLLYTPMMVFALLGFVTLYKMHKKQFYSVLLFFILSFYLIASWSCWWYADCFSQRVVIPMYVLLAIPLGSFIEYFINQRNWKMFLLITVLAAIISLNLFQSWQFLNGIIHTSRMTKEYYQAVFLRTDIKSGSSEMLLIDRGLTPEQILKSGKKFTSARIAHLRFEDNGVVPDDSIAITSNRKVAIINKENQLSPFVDIAYKDLTLKDYGIIRVRSKVFSKHPVSENPFSLNASFMHKAYAYNFMSHSISNENWKINEWNEVELYYLIPEVRNENDIFRTQIWLKGIYPIYVDEIIVDLFLPNDN
jgi:hypothetical protein